MLVSQIVSHPPSGWVQNFTTQHQKFPSSQHHKLGKRYFIVIYLTMNHGEEYLQDRKNLIQRLSLLGYDEPKCRIFWVFALETAAFWTLTDDGIPSNRPTKLSESSIFQQSKFVQRVEVLRLRSIPTVCFLLCILFTTLQPSSRGRESFAACLDSTDCVPYHSSLSTHSHTLLYP